MSKCNNCNQYSKTNEDICINCYIAINMPTPGYLFKWPNKYSEEDKKIMVAWCKEQLEKPTFSEHLGGKKQLTTIEAKQRALYKKIIMKFEGELNGNMY